MVVEIALTSKYFIFTIIDINPKTRVLSPLKQNVKLHLKLKYNKGKYMDEYFKLKSFSFH